MGNKPHIVVIGTGALACLFGARLSQVAAVTLLGTWTEQIDAINGDGLRLREMSGAESEFKLKTARFPDDVQSVQPADYALVLVKSYQTAVAAERIKAIIKPNGVVLSLQNGLGNQEKLLHALPFHMVSSGVTMQGANIVQPGLVVHAGNGYSVIDDKPFLVGLKELMAEAGLLIQDYAEFGFQGIEAVLWHKLIINAAINPLTALLDKPNGYLAQNKVARRLCLQTTHEALAVSQKEITFETNSNSEQAWVRVVEQTKHNRSSMLQDVTNGRRTEIDSICGEIVHRGRKSGMKAPINRLWLKLIQDYEASGQRLEFTADELSQLVNDYGVE
ncbi:MAG: 2-dehydropantoate 2-reductase [Chloroflexota bacterium]